MGIFDSVYVPCPTCGQQVEHQTKVGDPYMNVYTIDTASAEILTDIMNDPEYCQACGGWMVLVDPAFPPGHKPKPSLRAVKVKAPENPTTHPQGFRWWPDGKLFTYDDLVDPIEPAGKS